MKVLVIPDVHLKPWMFQEAAGLMAKEKADRAVCLMDIADDWGKEYQLDLYNETYDQAIAFAKQFPYSAWCYGNHDLSYLWNEIESGFSYPAVPLVKKKIAELNHILPNDNPIRYVHKIDQVLFSHGGVSDLFVKNSILDAQEKDIDEILEIINGFGRTMMWKDESPIWLRPQHSKKRMYRSADLLQVVGHTPVEHVIREGNLISCDLFSTYANGMPIGTENFLLLDTKTWDYQEIR